MSSYSRQKKYSERDRELKRQIEETEKIKNLYSEHNRAKLDEVLVLKLKQRLALTNEVVLDDTEEVSVLPELTEEMKVIVLYTKCIIYLNKNFCYQRRDYGLVYLSLIEKSDYIYKY